MEDTEVKVFERYLNAAKDLNPNRSGGKTSPHKACLMFAVLDLIEEGRIRLNAIYYNDELKKRFAWHFQRFKSSSDRLNSANPFFYLRSSDFWNHKIKPNKTLKYSQIKTPSDSLVRDTIEYAYLDDTLFLMLKEPSNLRAFRVALSANVDRKEEGFRLWAKAIGKPDFVIDRYITELNDTASNLLHDAKLVTSSVLDIGDYFEVSRLITSSNQVNEFMEYNDLHKGILTDALELYKAYLDELTAATTQNDIAEIESDQNIEETEKTLLIQARRGQGKFRERLIQHWKKCSVTGYENISLLVASHIKPWSQSDNGERLDPFNGLLLTPNLDKAFDLSYVSFSEKGQILISDALGDFSKLGIHQEMRVPLHDRHQDYMDYHRQSYLNKLHGSKA